MARDEVRVSLFPFMSVLACTIGALILLLASLSLSAVAPRDAAPRNPPPSGDGAAKSAGPSRVAPRAGKPEQAALSTVESLLARVDRALAAESEDGPLPLAALEERLAASGRSRRLAADLAALEAARAKLEKERETVETSVEVLESRRETLPILIDPTGLSRHLNPWFVECDAGGATAHRASDGTRVFLPRDELSASLDYGRYLRRLRAMPGVLLVLLIRPDGLQTAGIAARVAEAAGVRVATLPLPGTGELDWSLLRRAETNGPRAEAGR
ncbi:MAG: hypothetical protein IPK00_02615 [Deltaproteobacteria bacterium]|nr:hypothetical protein [Deltaproteobacteria bacterium]